jgi:enoyl-CoA hydratase
MTQAEIVTRQEGAVYRIELNRPEIGNLVTTKMIAGLSDTVRRVSGDAKLIVISGAGADFCKGRDYQTAPESAGTGRPPTARRIIEETATPILETYGAIKESPVPTLAIVQGAAHGFGCALAGACDVVFAGEGSRFRFPEMERGLAPTLAMCAVMDRASPRAVSYLIYSTAEVDARTALGMGLVSAIFPDAELSRQAEAFAATVSGQPLDAVMAVKEYLKRAPLMEPRGRSDYAASLFATVLSSR